MSIVNSPLGNGLLSGKYSADHQFSPEDFRGAGHVWATSFEGGRPKQALLDKLEAIREVLTMDGRSLVQGALAWVWGKSEHTLPIPGFKTVAQVEENCATLQFDAMPDDQITQIETILSNL